MIASTLNFSIIFSLAYGSIILMIEISASNASANFCMVPNAFNSMYKLVGTFNPCRRMTLKVSAIRFEISTLS